MTIKNILIRRLPVVIVLLTIVCSPAAGYAQSGISTANQNPGTAAPSAPTGIGAAAATPGTAAPTAPGGIAAAAASTPGGPPKPDGQVRCAWKIDYINPVCWVRAAFAGIGAFFMWIGIKVASLAGWVFEVSLKYLIVEFGNLIRAIKPGIDVGWTALRDIANIIIIGMFVFIAINIILGVKEFGDKKKVAQVLIVAVLINFSLLFTKVIVDASNFTAYQFYNSMVKGRVSQNTPTNSAGATLDGSGVSAEFLRFLGVSGIADSYNTLRQAQENTQYAISALGYGLLALVLLLAVAFVFFYGTYLIVSRAVLIVFLMLTSAIAFASWLIPQQYIVRGFAKWWESLLKTAFFAPILIALLWITINVSDTFGRELTKITGAKGSLGALAANTSTEANATALLSFLVILGLLFASFAAANAFSKTISGFRFAKAATGATLGLPFTVGSRLLGMTGRTLIGGPAAAGLRAMRRYTWEPGQEQRQKGLQGVFNRSILNATRRLSTATFDPLRVKPVSTLAGTVGGGAMRNLEDISRKLGEGGYAGVMERKARAADEKARAIGPTGGQEKQLRETMRQAATDTATQARQTIREETRAAETRARQNQPDRRQAEDRVRAHEEELARIQNERSATTNRQKAEMQATAQTIDQARKTALQRAHTEELNTLSGRERQHREELTSAQEIVERLNEAARQAAENEMRPRVEGLTRQVKQAEEKVEGVVQDQRVALRKALLWDPRAKKYVEDATQRGERIKNWKEWTAANKDLMQQKATPPTTPPPPAGGNEGH